MRSLQNIKKEVLKPKDKRKQPIDPGILGLVIGLRAFNIPIKNSCAGHTQRNWTSPYIDIYAVDEHISFDDHSSQMNKIKKAWIRKNIAIQNKLIKLLTEFYKGRKVEYKRQISLHTTIDWSWVRLK